MEKVRIGNDMRVNFSVYRNGEPESFDGASNIVTKLVNEAYNKLITHTYTIAGNIVQFDIDALQLTQCGKCRLFISYTKGGDYTVDSPAFELVNYTDQTGGTEIIGVEIVSINISGDIGINRDGLSAYEVWEAYPGNEGKTIEQYFTWLRENPTKIDLDGLNSNIDKLHFNPDTLVQLTNVGDVRYSTESRTLEVKVSDTVSIQLGQEMQTRVKNNAGAQINNGQMVYIDSAAGANPLAKIASTANADIAQRTFGMATENIPANGFGAITTEGLVRDVNTSAFAEGAMLWLGTNGNVTNIEPIAPTSKISIGMVLRSNIANGAIYVKIRAIARNQKLSDVYAPTLTTGDVLRWNSTTLRFEVYNLSNKADLVAGKIPASQLPAYVDDIIEYANLAAFPAVGETGKLYVTLDTNLTYRWSGSAYTEVSKSLAIGITSTTAFRGDWGKIAYDHSQLTNSNPHGTTAAQISNTPAGTISSTTVQAAINDLDADRVQLETDLNEAITALEQEQIQGGVYDVSSHNDGAVFESLSTLLGSANLSTLIPTSVRRGGMSIRFIQGSVPNSDNKYIQARLMAQNFTTNVTQWQGMDDKPTAGSKNLVESGSVAKELEKINGWEQEYNINIPTGSAYSSIANLSSIIKTDSKVRLKIDGFVGKMHFQLLTSSTTDAYPNPQYLEWTGDNYYDVTLTDDANRYFIHCNNAGAIEQGGDVTVNIALVTVLLEQEAQINEIEKDVNNLKSDVSNLNGVVSWHTSSIDANTTEISHIENGYTPVPESVEKAQTQTKALTPSGSFVDGTGYSCSCNYYAVVKDEKYSVSIPKTPSSAQYFGLIGFMDSLSDETCKVQDISYQGVSLYEGEITSDRDGYMVVCYVNSIPFPEPTVFHIISRVPSVYEEIDAIEEDVQELQEEIGVRRSILYGKKIAYNGDSICESRNDPQQQGYNGGGYAQLIADATGCIFENRAISGGILASAVPEGATLPTRRVVSDISNMAADADLICIEGGVNDFWLKVPLGVVVDYPHDALTYSGPNPYDTTYDTTTILGALESIFYQATRRWIGKPIVFIITHKITTTLIPGSDYAYNYYQVVEGMKKCCEKWAIPYYNAFEESGFCAYNAVQKSNFTYNADGCHPNKAGYENYYVPQLIKLFESLLKVNE